MVARLMHGSTGVPKTAIVPRALLRSKSTKLKLPRWHLPSAQVQSIREKFGVNGGRQSAESLSTRLLPKRLGSRGPQMVTVAVTVEVGAATTVAVVV